MKIIKPYAKIMREQYGAAAMEKIEWCSRISHRSEEARKEDSWKRFLQSVVIDHGDWSVVEHVSVSVDMLVDRGITHELVRHRLFSYTQESTRFVNYEKKMPPSFIYPKPDVECELCLGGYTVKNEGRDGWHHGTMQSNPCPYEGLWLDAIDEAERHYISLMHKGWRPQEARSVFPNALASRIIMTGNLRNWRHFFIMRTTNEAHPQMRQVTIPLLADFKSTFPILFDDIEPNARQADNLKKPR